MDTIERLLKLKNFVDNRHVDMNADMILNTISDTLSSIIETMEKDHSIDNELRQIVDADKSDYTHTIELLDGYLDLVNYRISNMNH